MKITKQLARFKVYLGRTASYLSIVNFVMLAHLSINEHYKISIIIIIPTTLLIILFVGFIDNKLKIHEYEATINGDKMTQLQKIIDLITKKETTTKEPQSLNNSNI